jgi:RNA polymerase sigma-70 factor (ECF subfamily)
MSDAPVSASAENQFKRLFELTYREVRCFAERRLRDLSAVDDVVSETYLVAWRRFEQVPVNDAEALLWLYRVAQYGVLNAERGARRRLALRQRVREATAAGSGDSDRVMVLDEETEVLAAAFATLTQEERTILLLAAWEGLTGRALAVVLGCSAGAAATRLSRARSRFAEAVRAAELLEEERGSRDP